MMRCIIALALAWSSTAAAQESATYIYDVHGRLIEVERSSGADTAYVYDDADNRTSKETTGASSLRQGGGDEEAEANPASDPIHQPDDKDQARPPQH